MRLTIFYILLSVFILGGCGIKPNTLNAPAGTAQDNFPKTYPDISTDPK